MTALRRWTAAVVLLLSVVGLTACGRRGAETPDRPAPAPTRLDGTLSFLGSGESSGIWSLRGTTLVRTVDIDSDAFYQTASVSADGLRFAWVDEGQLRVGELGRSGDEAVGDPVVDATFTPQWTSDNAALIVRSDDGKFGRIDASSGAIEPLAAAPEPSVAFSADDAAYAIYGDATRQEWSIVALGSETVPAPVIPVPFRHYTRFQSLAPDGRHAVALLRGFTEPAGPGSRTLEANAIVDLVTGTAQRIPGGGTVRQGYFRADGGAVLRVSEGLADRIVLISPEGDVVDRVDLPGDVADLSLLGFAPTPTPAAEPSPTPAPSPSPTPTPTPAEPGLEGTLFFLGDGLHTLRAGTLTLAVVGSGAAFRRSVTVSPDGSRYAFVVNRRLRVAPLDGDPVAIGPSTLDNAFPPIWSADGTSVTVHYEQTQFASIDIATGVATPVPPFAAVSPDGAYAVVADGSDYSITHVDSEQPPPLAVVVPEDLRIDRFASLSPDGHHALVLAVPAGDEPAGEGRLLSANAIIDLTTGTSVPVPGGGTLREGFFLADGSVVLRVTSDEVDQIVLVSRMGEVRDRLDLPPGVAELALLGYAA